MASDIDSCTQVDTLEAFFDGLRRNRPVKYMCGTTHGELNDALDRLESQADVAAGRVSFEIRDNIYWIFNA